MYRKEWFVHSYFSVAVLEHPGRGGEAVRWGKGSFGACDCPGKCVSRHLWHPELETELRAHIPMTNRKQTGCGFCNPKACFK